MLNFICDGLTICAYNIRKLIYNDDYVIIKFYSNGEHYIYSFVWKNPPKRITDEFIRGLAFYDYRTFVTSFKNDYELLHIVYGYYEKIFFKYLFLSGLKKRYTFMYIAPYKPNQDYLYYYYSNKYKYINKYLRQITELKLQLEKFNIFINGEFKIKYIEYKKIERQRFVKRTTVALQILYNNFNIDDNVLDIIKTYIL